MKSIKILHMYADMLDLYGDGGNMEIMKYRCAKRGIECQVDSYSINSPKPDYTSAAVPTSNSSTFRRI